MCQAGVCFENPTERLPKFMPVYVKYSGMGCVCVW